MAALLKKFRDNITRNRDIFNVLGDINQAFDCCWFKIGCNDSTVTIFIWLHLARRICLQDRGIFLWKTKLKYYYFYKTPPWLFYDVNTILGRLFLYFHFRTIYHFYWNVYGKDVFSCFFFQSFSFFALTENFKVF